MLFHFITPHHKLLMATHLILANLLQTDSITGTTSLPPSSLIMHLLCNILVEHVRHVGGDLAGGVSIHCIKPLVGVS